jgi:RNA polymerase sigma-70 factor (ECF subfamily)
MEFDDRIRLNLQLPGQKPETSWQYNRLRDSVRQLGPQQKHFIDLAFFEGFTHSEIAARSGLPLGTVKTRIRGALHQLKEALRA